MSFFATHLTLALSMPIFKKKNLRGDFFLKIGILCAKVDVYKKRPQHPNPAQNSVYQASHCALLIGFASVCNISLSSNSLKITVNTLKIVIGICNYILPSVLPSIQLPLVKKLIIDVPQHL